MNSVRLFAVPILGFFVVELFHICCGEGLAPSPAPNLSPQHTIDRPPFHLSPTSPPPAPHSNGDPPFHLSPTSPPPAPQSNGAPPFHLSLTSPPPAPQSNGAPPFHLSLTSPPPATQSNGAAAGKKLSTILAIIIATIVGVAILAIIAWTCMRKLERAFPTRKPPASNVIQVWMLDAPTMERFLQDLEKEKVVRFSAQQLCSFTNNYSTELGSGGFGIVYKGQFPNGVKIAVKVLKKSSLDKRAEAQFMAEVSTIGRTYHINLVRLYGFSYDSLMSALVYEYMDNGSLDKHLFSDNTQRIDWNKLPKIAIGIARGIAYLHEECQQRIIHYDIKPGNVLLDANFNPKIADFGLAKISNRDITHDSSTGYKGTPGYSAPEFLLNNYPITCKCDVYSFGMLLFEIVGRRRNTKVGPTDSLDWFPKCVWDEYEKGALATLTLSFGIEEKDREIAERMAMVALWCVQDSPEARPPMSVVVKMLEGGVEITPPPKPFHYLYSVGVNGLRPPTCNSSDFSTSYGTNSYWYKEQTTTIMAKYEIEIASSS